MDRSLSNMATRVVGLDLAILPPVEHAVLDTDPSIPLVLIGDVHGCADELEDLLVACKEELVVIHGAERASQRKIIFVGDLVNKGPKNIECIEIAQRENALNVRGNHEHSVLHNYHQRRKDFRTPLGWLNWVFGVDQYYAWTDGLTTEQLAYLQETPFTLHLKQHDAMVVHAGLVPGVALEKQTHFNMMMMRDVFADSTGAWQGVAKQQQGSVPWAEQWTGPLHLYFGHDAMRTLQLCKHATGLDTGCLYGKTLTAMLLPSKRLVSVKAKKTHIVPGVPPPKGLLLSDVARLFRHNIIALALPMLPLIAKSLKFK
eukprot:m.134668 g.134668  ORF g.134668 m.134668 type:complete len:315 (+) comp29750_c1_seq2:2-946(+)